MTNKAKALARNSDEKVGESAYVTITWQELPMLVSEHFSLNRTQPTLDFVDVDIFGDVCVFMDPRALRLLRSQWASGCVSIIQDFFQTVLRSIHAGQDAQARRLLGTLREPNETHLGLSQHKARGHALGHDSAGDVWDSLRKSEAVKSGLLEDLEDTILMVEGISSDIISDIVTNIIREPLIRYTHDMAQYYGITLTPDVVSGPLWDPIKHEWYSRYAPLPVTDYGKLLLVPKIIVRRRMDYDEQEYYQHYILEHLIDMELSANTELVHLLKNGRQRVYKKELRKKYGQSKAMIISHTLRYPEILEQYRADKRGAFRPPLFHEDIADVAASPSPDWDALVDSVVALPTGREHSTAYENAVEQLLTALFYPALCNPQVQHEIHNGRKRIDITYTNAATVGFFAWLAAHYPAAHVFVECKNYGREAGNPELDQLGGRFSPSRGRFGILACRSFQDKNLFIQRCRDTAQDDRGYIIPLDDGDLRLLTDHRKSSQALPGFKLLKDKFDQLIM